MRTLGRVLLLALVAGAVALGIWYVTTQRTVALEARPAGSQGGLQWAYGLALPQARSATAPDALLVAAEGDHLLPDGRLAANTGDWRLTFDSFTANARVVVSVRYTGEVSMAGASIPGVIRAVGSPPGTFPDSIAIFASTTGRGASGERRVINPVILAYDDVAGTHIWRIVYTVNGTTEIQRVRWDNVWLGM